ncbi:MAG TPA: tyrosine-protein phosphatase [Pyrinomonadaceae bacterium]|nr:tyrosine-protein phosphatase [Pyrinomonadaceae bacterium]
MDLSQNSFRSALAAMAFILTLAVTAAAQESAGQSIRAGIRIKNFGQMDERFYRGAQPRKEKDYADLAALGIKTVIDLREDPEEYERPMVEALGMKYVNIPMVGKKYPTEEATSAFLKIVGDPQTGKFFVHCAGGRHRTGAMGAVYRYQFYNWNFDQVYAEMKQYDFYTSWGHGAFKDFVKDYYERMLTDKTSAIEIPASYGDGSGSKR